MYSTAPEKKAAQAVPFDPVSVTSQESHNPSRHVPQQQSKEPPQETTSRTRGGSDWLSLKLCLKFYQRVCPFNLFANKKHSLYLCLCVEQTNFISNSKTFIFSTSSLALNCCNI